MVMNEYRCTRPDLYTSPRCPGYLDSTAREGHYIRAENELKARIEMQHRYPNDSHFSVSPA